MNRLANVLQHSLSLYTTITFCVILQVGSKSVKQCVQFYYLWKKVCADEYKRLRIIRRKREQDELYNLRSKAQQEKSPSPLANAVSICCCEYLFGFED